MGPVLEGADGLSAASAACFFVRFSIDEGAHGDALEAILEEDFASRVLVEGVNSLYGVHSRFVFRTL